MPTPMQYHRCARRTVDGGHRCPYATTFVSSPPITPGPTRGSTRRRWHSMTELYRRPVGVFFSSLHGTLNHLLLSDRIWLKRLTGEGDHPNRLDAILYEDRLELASARAAEDQRLVRVVEGFAEEAYAQPITYRTTRGVAYEQALSDILAHLFNHQTHHRGQAHSCLSILTGAEPPSLDLLLRQRGEQAPDLAALARGG
jgi:uncharacterized damage-inducible protein DinB